MGLCDVLSINELWINSILELSPRKNIYRKVQEKFRRKKHSNYRIHSNVQIVFRLFTILLLMEMCPPKKQFTIGQYHQITIIPYNYFTILPYVQKILIHYYTIFKMK